MCQGEHTTYCGFQTFCRIYAPFRRPDALLMQRRVFHAGVALKMLVVALGVLANGTRGECNDAGVAWFN